MNSQSYWDICFSVQIAGADCNYIHSQPLQDDYDLIERGDFGGGNASRTASRTRARNRLIKTLVWI